jgi:hypothetical protein
MIAPAPAGGGYPLKLAALSSLQQTLTKHNTSGGTYTVATPSYLYTNCLLIGVRDISGADTQQVQTRWQWDFIQPLLTLAAAQSAQNSLMSKISGGTQLTGDPPKWSGKDIAVGKSGSGVAPPLVPAGTNTAGTNVGIGSGTQLISSSGSGGILSSGGG